MSDVLTGLPSPDLWFCENNLQRLNGGAGSVVANVIPDAHAQTWFHLQSEHDNASRVTNPSLEACYEPSRDPGPPMLHSSIVTNSLTMVSSESQSPTFNFRSTGYVARDLGGYPIC
ncbi:hypothetical protein M404DRAFT_992717 [Pisolithus tinctorius Marx 270]|uniref:Uncharacterized protein n=1 Tax=Pisolithus tinctorius Marx 270 TaxID=870435 RepID=A0A0C3PGP1_PISTI|nr:hypothetical protein M404DRAFT_992717 [Pisolithus tinctorius Marx 270]